MLSLLHMLTLLLSGPLKSQNTKQCFMYLNVSIHAYFVSSIQIIVLSLFCYTTASLSLTFSHAIEHKNALLLGNADLSKTHLTERKQSAVWSYVTRVNTNITNCSVFKNVICYNSNNTVLYKPLKTCNNNHKGRQEEEGNPSERFKPPAQRQRQTISRQFIYSAKRNIKCNCSLQLLLQQTD